MKPVILKNIINRKENVPVKLVYNHKMGLNLVEINNESKIFIEQDSKCLSLLTKTKVKNESDDDNFPLLQLTTKTFVKQERDDDKDFNHIQ